MTKTAVFACLVVSAILLVGAGPMPKSFGHGTIDQKLDGPFDSLETINGAFGPSRQSVAQEFTPTVTNLSAVDLYLHTRSAETNCDETWEVKIWEGSIGNVLLGSKIINPNYLAGRPAPPHVEHVDFNSPLPITPGTTHVIEIVPQSLPDPLGNCAWALALGSDPYPGGSFLRDGRSIDTDLRKVDAGFSTYYEEQPSVIEVDVDIKPGSDPSSVNCKKEKGSVPVAVFGSDEFDASTIDLETLQLNGEEVTEVHNKIHLEDVNEDEVDDAVLHLDKGGVCQATSDVNKYPLRESVDATLSGSTIDDEAFEGTGDIRIVNR